MSPSQLAAANPSDQNLWQQVKLGEQASLKVLFMRYYDPLVRFCTPILKDEERARDLVQDTFFQVWEKREKIEISSSIKAYLYTAVRNRALNTLKREARMQWSGDHTELEPLQEGQDGSYDRMREKDLNTRLQYALSRLPAKCRQVFELSRFEHLSNREVAETLEISVKTVENQMTKALQIMRKELLPYLSSVVLIGYWFL